MIGEGFILGLLLGLWFLFGHIIKKHSGNQSGKSVKKHQIPDIASAFKPKSKNEQRKQPRALPSWAAAMKSKRKSKQRPIIQTSELRPDLLNREDVLITDRSNIDFEIAALRRISQHQQVTSNRTDRSNSYISDRELSDFRITINTTSTHARGSSSKNKKPAKWIHPGQTVKIANIDIKGGYFYLVPDEALKSFLNHCSQKIGDAYFRTPRNTIKAFVDMLAVLEQNPDINWQDLVDKIDVEEDRVSDMPEVETMREDELASFTIQ